MAIDDLLEYWPGIQDEEPVPISEGGSQVGCRGHVCSGLRVPALRVCGF